MANRARLARHRRTTTARLIEDAIVNHAIVEKNIGLMIVLIVIAISFGGLVEIVPLIFQKETTTPAPGLKPLTALQLEGRDVYIREGCHVCHTQMIRTLRAEVERYGHYSEADEFVYDHPFLWGSKRTGPDLARVGGRYQNRLCRLIRGCLRIRSTARSPGAKWKCCANSAYRIPMPISLAQKRLSRVTPKRKR